MLRTAPYGWCMIYLCVVGRLLSAPGPTDPLVVSPLLSGRGPTNQMAMGPLLSAS